MSRWLIKNGWSEPGETSLGCFACSKSNYSTWCLRPQRSKCVHPRIPWDITLDSSEPWVETQGCDCCLSLLPSVKVSDPCALVSSIPAPHLRLIWSHVKSSSLSRQCWEIAKKDYGFIGVDYKDQTVQILCTLSCLSCTALLHWSLCLCSLAIEPNISELCREEIIDMQVVVQQSHPFFWLWP